MLFDVDGTLVRGLSTEQAFFLYLLRRGVLGPRQGLSWLGFSAAYLPRAGRSVFQKNKAWLAGLCCREVAARAESFVRDVLPGQLDPQACACLSAHLRERDRVWLLTGTPDFIARPLARSLGAHGYRAAVCDRSGERFAAGLPLEHPYAGEKLRIAREISTQEGISLSCTVAYADSVTDIALLSAVGHPVAVNARRRVRLHARRNGWDILGSPP